MRPSIGEPAPEQLRPVLDVVSDLAGGFAAAGRRLYLVGGVVRDLLLGSLTEVDDIDLTTDAVPAEVKRITAPHADDLWTQGERFGTIGAMVDGRVVEITTHRAESYDATTRKPVVAFGHSIEADLSRRDFTINAMAIELPSTRLIDPHGGRRDLAAGDLRTPLAPDIAFDDDPLRMMRAARFIPRFGLRPDGALVTAATERAARLDIVSVERVHDELERLLAVPSPGPGVEFLAATGLLVHIVPALAGRAGAVEAAVTLASAPGSSAVRRAGLVAAAGDAGPAALARLRYSRDDQHATLGLLAAVAVLAGGDDEAVRRAVDRVGLPAMADVERLATNLRMLAPGVVDDPPPATVFDRYRSLARREDLTDLAAPLSGAEVMELLGVPPGPVVGRAVAHLRHRRIVDGPTTPVEARRDLERWWLDEPDEKSTDDSG
ncbi:MAG: CCA tRNA nucleotidyltransferase [Acidimicrobiales bacterium]